MDNWPVSLQQHLNSSDFNLKFGTTALRTDMDVGPAKVRSRFTDAVDIYLSSILLDYADYETLKDFFKTTLNNGVLPFTFTDPLTGVTGNFRFTEPPGITALGGRTFRVAMNWEKVG